LRSMERMPTGIPGLDKMIEGGLPRPSLTLLAGEAGAGKTTFCTQFLCKGAELGQRGLYLRAFGGPPDLLINYASCFEFVKSTYFGQEICYVELEEMMERACQWQDFLDLLKSRIESIQPARMVMEDLSLLEDILKDEYWRFLLKLSHLIKDSSIVALLAEDALPGAAYLTHIAQVADGIILLQNEEMNFTRRRSLEVIKMSGTSHNIGKHAVDISAKGLTVYPGL